jgi:hypothetical protein
MCLLNSPNFWQSTTGSIGTLMTDGSLKLVLLDKTY